MASSSRPKRSYEVFLSFRGTDVRKNFLGHLYRALDQNGIYAFIDDEELRKGDQISLELMQAIDESCIAIIVFSENYASSRWCLEELAKIMECKEHKNLTVLPVFLRVEPREVREGRESYGKAMATHESKLGNDSEKVRRWKKALIDAGSLSGWHLNDEGDESELIQNIVNVISTHLARTPLHIAKHLVRIDSQVVKLKSMLNLESKDHVIMVGLWGQGGIGKTTLGKALYNDIFRQFDGSCFLANVREASKNSKDLVSLQEKLLSEILSLQQGLVVSSVDEGIDILQRRLGSKKVLVILDDVDDLRQLDALAGEGKFYGNGSRIIVTTRDKHLLSCHGINQGHVYEVELLGYSESLDLLSRHAFRTQQKSKIREHLVNGVVNYAQGLPLALEVLGSFLHDKGEDVWESTLRKLFIFPDDKINNVLKISYDGLGKNEQEIFLHIVCFFKRNNSQEIKKVLDNCDLAATSGLEVLEDRALISTMEDGAVNMHDLIQAMGVSIVNQENDLGKRSRLWTYNDVNDVLQRDMGDCAVEAIVLNPRKLTQMYFDHDAFKKMRMLKLLIMRNVHNSFDGPIYLPNNLRWFELTRCNWRPEFSSRRKGQAAFLMNWWITRPVKQCEDFRKLKYIKLDGCDSLVCTPDLSCTPNLEEMRLEYCKRLGKAHTSIACHDKLQVLIFESCPNFRDFPKVLESKNLREFEILFCPKFKRFPDIPHRLEGLEKLTLIDVSIEKLPASIENLAFLKKMEITSYRGKDTGTISIPCTIYKLQELQTLKINGFPIRLQKRQISADLCVVIGLPKLIHLDLSFSQLSKVEFLEDLSCFPLLRELRLLGNNITSLPTSISKRDHLSKLNLCDCHQLQEIPDLPPFLKYLNVDRCELLYGRVFDWWARQASLAQDLSCFCHLPRRKVPKWFQHMENGSISFRASEELYNKFLGLIFYVDHYDNKPRQEIWLDARFEGKRCHSRINIENTEDYSYILLAFVSPSYLWKEVDFGQISGSYAQFSLNIGDRGANKQRLRILCKQLGDHLKTEIRDNRLIELSTLYEVGNNSINPEIESSHTRKDNLIEANQQENSRYHQVSTDEQSKRVQEGDHEHSSLEACKPRSRRLPIRLTEMSMGVFGRCFHCRK